MSLINALWNFMFLLYVSSKILLAFLYYMVIPKYFLVVFLFQAPVDILLIDDTDDPFTSTNESNL